MGEFERLEMSQDASRKYLSQTKLKTDIETLMSGHSICDKKFKSILTRVQQPKAKMYAIEYREIFAHILDLRCQVEEKFLAKNGIWSTLSKGGFSDRIENLSSYGQLWQNRWKNLKKEIDGSYQMLDADHSGKDIDLAHIDKRLELVDKNIETVFKKLQNARERYE